MSALNPIATSIVILLTSCSSIVLTCDEPDSQNQSKIDGPGQSYALSDVQADNRQLQYGQIITVPALT
jgi:hypothetical protein